jgi:hypothetical protein
MALQKKLRAENACYSSLYILYFFPFAVFKYVIKPYRTGLFIFWDVAKCNLIVVTNHNFISNFVLRRKLGLSHGGKNRLRVFENLVFKTVFRLRREKVRVGWKKLQGKDYYKFYSFPNVISMIKSKGIRWVEQHGMG